jgi:hypothetical protein
VLDLNACIAHRVLLEDAHRIVGEVSPAYRIDAPQYATKKIRQASSTTSRHKSCEARLLCSLVAQPCCLAYTRTSPMWSTARGGPLANHSCRPPAEPAVGNLQISRGTSDLQALRHVMARATREQLPNGAGKC